MQLSNKNPCSTVQVADGLVEVDNSFAYLGSKLHDRLRRCMAAEGRSYEG